jgi:hypothetical protein
MEIIATIEYDKTCFVGWEDEDGVYHYRQEIRPAVVHLSERDIRKLIETKEKQAVLNRKNYHERKRKASLKKKSPQKEAGE